MAWCLCGYDAGGGVRFPAASGGRPEGARKLTSMISFNNLALSSSICCSTCVSCGTSGCPFCFCGGFGGCGGAGSMALAPCPRYRRCSCSPRTSLVLFFSTSSRAIDMCGFGMWGTRQKEGCCGDDDEKRGAERECSPPQGYKTWWLSTENGITSRTAFDLVEK